MECDEANVCHSLHASSVELLSSVAFEKVPRFDDSQPIVSLNVRRDRHGLRASRGTQLPAEQGDAGPVFVNTIGVNTIGDRANSVRHVSCGK